MSGSWLLRRSPTDLPAAFDVLRWVVVLSVTLDAVTSTAAVYLGLDTTTPGGLWVTAEAAMVVGAVAALVWRWTRLGAVLAVVVALMSIRSAPGLQVYVGLVVLVLAAVRADRRQQALVLGAWAVYSVAFGVAAEAEHDGWFWAVQLDSLITSVVCGGVGLGVRRLLAAHARRRRRIDETARENAQIRAVERARLAGELQRVVLVGLAAVSDVLDAPAARSTDPARLHDVLGRVEDLSRSVLTELRTLLEVLRRPLAPTDAGGLSNRRRSLVAWATGRPVRVAVSVLLALATVASALLDAGAGSGPDGLQRTLGVAACAVAVWAPIWAVPVAGAALTVSVVAPTQGFWDLIAAGLLVLLATVRYGSPRLWLVLAGAAAYDVVATLAWGGDRYLRAAALPYVVVPVVLVALVVRHFLTEHRESQQALAVLLVQRRRVDADERHATARELHDVVGHQLSVTTLLVLSTADSDDPEVLRRTLARVRRSADAAGAELTELVASMTAAEAGPEPVDAGPDLPELAARLVDQLTDHGHRADLELWVGLGGPDGLEETTRRTLGRIMQEAVTNILRYAPADADCRLALIAPDADSVRLRVSSALATDARRSHLSLGWGLRGIRERVELSGGTFAAGPEGDRWVLVVDLPTAASRRAALV